MCPRGEQHEQRPVPQIDRIRKFAYGNHRTVVEEAFHRAVRLLAGPYDQRGAGARNECGDPRKWRCFGIETNG